MITASGGHKPIETDKEGKEMNGKIIAIIAIAAIVAIGAGAIVIGNMSGDDNSSSTVTPSTDSRTSETTEIDTGEEDSSTTVITGDYPFEIVCEEGTANCYTISTTDEGYTVTFSGMAAESSYSIAGTLTGNIVVDNGSFDFELILNGITITTSKEVPIYITSESDVTITAKKNTTNTIYDNRSAVSSEGISASVYSDCDLKIKGNGKLVIVSTNNNGIHSKDDLSVKNLTLYVTAVDNCLKGNDSVEITSGTITLNATSGDGIKTTSTDLSSSGNQRGTVTINSDDGNTVLTIRAYCDGIDASFDVVIEETESNSVSVDIIAGTGASSTATLITGAPMGPGGSTGPGEWGGQPGGESWMQGGGDSQGNKNVVSYSCKGIKASDAIIIKSGTIIIDAFDDALHANNDDTLDSGKKPTGNITISGGTVTLNSMDDGVHADGTLSITGGTVSVTGSFEALEGYSIVISSGSVSLVSDDDGVNATGGGLNLSGGYLYIYAGGDGLDTNYSSISFNGTDVIVISTSGGNSAIDADYSYTYSSGTILAICPSGMTNEITSSKSFSQYGTQKNMGSLSKGTIVTATVGGTLMAAVELPCSVSSACAFYIGSNSASISTTSSLSNLDDNGVYLK